MKIIFYSTLPVATFLTAPIRIVLEVHNYGLATNHHEGEFLVQGFSGGHQGLTGGIVLILRLAHVAFLCRFG
ncbi:MAG: hypothetical protein FDZ72_13435 [Betaproteobacteria bacterium]|nr:MAG: hypothetical protein FDZ72_13435 [Betaproteobacteria bacterium]